MSGRAEVVSEVESAVDGAQEEDMTEGKDDEKFILCRPCNPVTDNEAEDAEDKGQVQRPLRDPGMHTAQEIEEHNISHIPFRPWCLHCLRGKGKDTHSRSVKGNFAEDLVPRVRMDYTSLTKNLLQAQESTHDPPFLAWEQLD